MFSIYIEYYEKNQTNLDADHMRCSYGCGGNSERWKTVREKGLRE